MDLNGCDVRLVLVSEVRLSAGRFTNDVPVEVDEDEIVGLDRAPENAVREGKEKVVFFERDA